MAATNRAYNYNMEPEKKREAQRPPQRKPKVEIVEKPHFMQAVLRRKALVNCIVIAVITALLLVVVSFYAQIAALNVQNIRQAEKNEALQVRYDQKSIEMAARTDMSAIQKRAEKELGMGFPDNSQIRYIEITEGAEAAAGGSGAGSSASGAVS